MYGKVRNISVNISRKKLPFVHKFLCATLMIVLVTGCSNSVDVESKSSPTPKPTTRADFVDNFWTGEFVRTFQESLENVFVYAFPIAETLVFFVCPSQQCNYLRVEKDDGYNQLTLSIEGYIDEEDLRLGKKEAIIAQAGKIKYRELVCAKDSMNDFATEVLLAMRKVSMPLPEKSLKLILDFSTTIEITEPKKDEFGNVIKGETKTQQNQLMVHISRANLEKIQDPESVPNYFKISDIENPSLPPREWSSCQSTLS